MAVERPGDGFSINLSHYRGLWDNRRFCRRNRSFNKEKKSTGGGQNKKKKKKSKSDEIETLIDELEKRSCLWDIFDKEYHNREKRDIAYTELEDILKHTKQDIKTKIAGLRTQLGREISETNCWKSEQATSEKYKSTWVFYDKLQFLRPVTQAAKSKDNLSPDQQLLNDTQDEFHEESLSSASPAESLEATPRISKNARNPWRPGKRTFYRLASKYFERQLALSLNLC